MRLFFSSASFMFTIIVAVAAFVLAAIHAPTELKQLIDAANRLINTVLSNYVEDQYSILIGFVFDGKNLVLMGFIIVTRLILALFVSVLFPGAPREQIAAVPARQMQSQSPFKLWGRKSS